MEPVVEFVKIEIGADDYMLLQGRRTKDVDEYKSASILITNCSCSGGS